MSSSIHPSVQLRLILNEYSYEGGNSVEMARRFKSLAPTEVVRAEKGSQRANVLRFDLGSDAVTAEAETDSLWRDALVTWLSEEFDETSALVARESDARKNNGRRDVSFGWLEVKFGSGPVIAIRMNDSSIPVEAAGFVARARDLFAEGVFGPDPIEVIRIPVWPDVDASMGLLGLGEGETLAERIADEPLAMEPTIAEIDDALAEAERALMRGDDPLDTAVKNLDRAVDENDSGEEYKEAFDASNSSNEINYRIWNVVYGDGTSVRFDSVLGESLID